MIDAQLQADLNAVITRLRKIEPYIRKSGQADLAEASKGLVQAVKAAAPVGSKPHKRYPKLKGQKAARGSGKVLATYKPGNLKRSMRIMKFRRSPSVFVGAKLGLKTADGYYGRWVDEGTPKMAGKNFFKPAVNSAGPQTLRTASQLIAKRIQSYGRTNGF